MNKILMKHTNIMIRMRNNGLNEQLIKSFSLDKIIKACERIESTKILKDDYKENKIFQDELVRDEKFILYLNKVYEKELDVNGFEILLESIEQHNEKISDYPINNVLDILNNKELLYKAYYSYLKYYQDYTNNSNFKTIITKNLNHFYGQSDIVFDDLSRNEKELLKSNELDNYNLIPINDIKKIYEFLVNNEELKNLIVFLNSKEMYIPLNLKLYEHIAANAKEIKELLKKILKSISNNEIAYQLLLEWLNNDCKIYDLRVLESQILVKKRLKIFRAIEVNI